MLILDEAQEMLTIINGTNQKPVASERLIKIFSAHKTELEGTLFIGYPIIGTSRGHHSFDATYISESHGLVLFDLNETRGLDENYKKNQDDSYNKMESKLKSYDVLNLGRNLMVDIQPVTYAPFDNTVEDIPDSKYPVCDDSNIIEYVKGIDSSLKIPYYKPLLSAIQSISNIRKSKRIRIVDSKESKGARLQELEESIANLDSTQAEAVIQMANGVQRIRGLAGSGKTIVLALKVAYIHAQHPDWKIAVTFHTRSLKNQFKRLINSFVFEHTHAEPNWDNIDIAHSWGSHTSSGIYYKFCKSYNLPTLHDFSSAKNYFGYNDAFDGACKKALEEYYSRKQDFSIYDVIVVDESQDFTPSFLRICYEMLDDNKRLIYAYDELQNLKSQSLPSPEEIFGNDEHGNPRVIIKNSENQKNDIILERCYRNSKPVLTTAHALGFGIYRKPNTSLNTGLVQIFENNNLWLDVGYEIHHGELKEGEHVVLERTEKTSPGFLIEKLQSDDVIRFEAFESTQEQAEWVAKEIIKNLREDELRADDIIVINPDPLTTKNNVGIIRKILFDNQISSHLTGVDSSQDDFFDENHDSITFTGIYRAKGNEAGMVYVIHADDCYGRSNESNASIAINRNRLFTAITRSKAWVRVVGIGEDMRNLIDEFEQVKSHKYALSFVYPTEEQKEKIKKINRDVSIQEKKVIDETSSVLNKFISGIQSKNLILEDLPPNVLEFLREEINKL